MLIDTGGWTDTARLYEDGGANTSGGRLDLPETSH